MKACYRHVYVKAPLNANQPSNLHLSQCCFGIDRHDKDKDVKRRGWVAGICGAETICSGKVWWYLSFCSSPFSTHHMWSYCLKTMHVGTVWLYVIGISCLLDVPFNLSAPMCVLIQKLILSCLLSVLLRLWLEARKSIRSLINWMMRFWRCYLSRVKWKWFAYGPADATATPSSHASLKSRLVLPFWYWLTQVVLDVQILNKGKSSASMAACYIGYKYPARKYEYWNDTICCCVIRCEGSSTELPLTRTYKPIPVLWTFSRWREICRGRRAHRLCPAPVSCDSSAALETASERSRSRWMKPMRYGVTPLAQLWQIR